MKFEASPKKSEKSTQSLEDLRYRDNEIGSLASQKVRERGGSVEEQNAAYEKAVNEFYEQQNKE